MADREVRTVVLYQVPDLERLQYSDETSSALRPPSRGAPGPSAGKRGARGYGVMGLPFSSGHILGLRRWTASSVGDRFTSIWHRDPIGHWTFYESVDSEWAVPLFRR